MPAGKQTLEEWMPDGSESVEGFASRGGLARAASMTKAQRSELARAAARSRWGNRLPHATHTGEIVVGELTIQCFVLGENMQRILSQGGMIRALGLAYGSNPKLGGNRLANFAAGKLLSQFISPSLGEAIRNPIQFVMPNGGLAFGYDANMLVDLCEAVLALRRTGALQAQQERIAIRCEILNSGFARTGITALVDEATGYQADRAKDALARILEQFIAKELRKWVRTFPAEFYKEIFRLRGWNFGLPIPKEKPPLVGKLTNNIVYARLAPGVLEELKRITPKDEKGRHTQHLHRRLTEEIGHPRLREHLASVITLMRVSKDWDVFIEMLDRALPKYGQNYALDF